MGYSYSFLLRSDYRLLLSIGQMDRKTFLGDELTFSLGRLGKPPTDERIIYKSLENGHKRLPIISEDTHRDDTGCCECAPDAAHLNEKKMSYVCVEMA